VQYQNPILKSRFFSLVSGFKFCELVPVVFPLKLYKTVVIISLVTAVSRQTLFNHALVTKRSLNHSYLVTVTATEKKGQKDHCVD
jgi:hypothetical protein